MIKYIHVRQVSHTSASFVAELNGLLLLGVAAPFVAGGKGFASSLKRLLLQGVAAPFVAGGKGFASSLKRIPHKMHLWKPVESLYRRRN